MLEALRLFDPYPAAETSPEVLCDQANTELEHAPPQRIVEWASACFGDGLILSSSFGAESALMLHLVSTIVPRIPVVFLDTGYLFPETYQFAEQLRERFDLDIRVYGPSMTAARQEALFGRLWAGDEKALELYQRINKVEPMERAVRELGARAWIAGLRRQQTAFRSSLRPIELQDGIYKIHPIVDFTREDVERYMAEHELPYHPLRAQGYRSIGDLHSTRPVVVGEDERAGRALGGRSECGIHLPRSLEASSSNEASAR